MQSRPVADNLSEVRPAYEWAEAILNQANLPPDLRHDLHVCVEEALGNLIMHGQAVQAEKGIVLSIATDGETATVTVADKCEPFDVTVASLPNPPLLTNAQIGGHGLRLLRSLATKVLYRRLPGGNELTMIFRPKARAPAAGGA